MSEIDLKAGTRFEVEGNKFRVVTNNSIPCTGCAFYGNKELCESVLECRSVCRRDGKNVIAKKIK